MSADLLVLPDVVVLSRSRGHERPEILLLVLPHVQESSAHRGEQPLVKTRSVIVALEIVALERKVRERVRAIHEHFDSQRARHLHDLPHRHDLPCEVRHVRDLDHLRARSYCRSELFYDVIVRRRRDLERDLLHDDPIAPRTLIPGSDHPAVAVSYTHL